MFLHLGQDTLVNIADVVGVFDLDTASLEKRTREFLARAEKAGQVVNVSTELPKSFVVVSPAAEPGRAGWQDKGRLFISQISAPTLKKRLDNQAGRNAPLQGL
ncbi:MAG: extracellular matrix regulator RemB [Oscillospiraceae bacterium]